MIFDKYPYTNFHEMNDDWIIKTLREFGQQLDEFVAANSLTYADPIEYDPVTIYPANTVIIYNDTAYVSLKTVPAGILPGADNAAEYWLCIFPFGTMINDLINSGLDDLEGHIDDVMPALVNAWMDAHPDVTTTVQNYSITFPKLASQLQDVILAGYDTSGNWTTINKSEFVQGRLNNIDGSETVANNACRTGFIQFDRGILLIRAATGYNVNAYEYTMSSSLIGIFSLYDMATRISEAMSVDAEHQYRFVIMRSDSAALSPADLPNIPIEYNMMTSIYADYADAVMKNAIASEYSSASTYNVNDYVFHSGALYRCVMAITTAEAWTAAHWEAVALANEVSELKSATTKYTGNRPIEMTVGAYYPLNGTEITIGSPTANSGKEYALVPCSQGDVFTVSGTGGSSARPWGFVRSDGTIIITSNNTATVTIENVVIVAPYESAYLILNNPYPTTYISYYGEMLVDYAEEIKPELYAAINGLHNLINYEYDDLYVLPSSGNTGASAVGLIRDKNVFTLHTTRRPAADMRIKISGNVTRVSASSAAIDEWTGIQLEDGHTYLVKNIPLSGTSTAETPNAIAVYKQGEHRSIGESWVENGIYYRRFTYDGTPVSLVYAVAGGSGYDNYKCLVTLEDITDQTISDNTVDDYNASISTSGQGINDGIKLKVVSYNVAAYNNDTSVYLPTEKEINFKKMLCEIKPDILAIQEDKRYVDSTSARLALTSLYNPIFPYEYMDENSLTCTIRSKTPASAHYLVRYTTGRWIEYATYDIDGKTLLFGSTHTVANYNSTGVDSAESIAARLAEYQELIDWLNGEITLSSRSCPAYDWCIMCGDYNTITAEDKTNFLGVVTTGGFKVANGDWLGWIETNYKFTDPLCLDNVIVSDNVIFDSIISHSSMYKRLYSDHVPFEVTVTLQDN